MALLSISVTVSVGILSVLLYLFYQHKYAYWTRRGVPGPKPYFPYGNFPSMFTRHISEPIMKLYDEYKHLPYFGIYSLWYPVLIVNDVDLIKSILIRDTSHFETHGWHVNEKLEPLSAHMFSLGGNEWRTMREKFSPAFSAGKTKMMYSNMVLVADKFDKYIREKALETDILDFKQEMKLFLSENIANSVFGLETNSFTNGYNRISQYAIQLLVPTNFIGRIMLTLMVMAPNILKYLNIKIWDKSITHFFISLVENTIAMREKTSTERNDFMQILTQMKNNQFRDDRGNIIDQKIQLTKEQMASQAFLFFLAGFETSSITSSLTLHELAFHPEIQERARNEILEILERHGGICTYEALMEMKYLQSVVEETLRLHPPLGLVFRRCTEDYKIPGTDIVIEKNMQVLIPNINIQRDPQYYEEPEKFDPERFLPEHKSLISSCTYMPFGEGPRTCLGKKFAMVQSTLGLIQILKNFKVLPCEKTKNPVEPGASPIDHAPQNVWLKLTKIENAMKI